MKEPDRIKHLCSPCQPRTLQTTRFSCSMNEKQGYKEDGLTSAHYIGYIAPPRSLNGPGVSNVQWEENLVGEQDSHNHFASKIAIAVDPVALITTECITVTSAMRKHARWAHSSVSAILGGTPSSYRNGTSGAPKVKSSRADLKRPLNGVSGEPDANDDDSLTSRWGLRGRKGRSMQDNPLMSAFARLRSDLKSCKGMSTISPRSKLDSQPNRCSAIRYPKSTSPFSPSHPLFVHFGSHNLLGTRCHHEIFCVQPN